MGKTAVGKGEKAAGDLRKLPEIARYITAVLV
jgi:hypothetical protein